MPPFHTRPPSSRTLVQIEADWPCPSCGYNLRGLMRGQKCPECGLAESSVAVGRDVLLAAGTGERARWKIGFGLVAVCVFVAMAARVGAFILGAAGVTDELVIVYRSVGAINSLLWIVAVFLVTPRTVARSLPALKAIRWGARGLALMWIVGYAGRLTGDLGADLLGRLLGGVGVMLVAFILHRVAEEALLESAARRLNAVVWILWFPTLLAQAFPDGVAWFTLIPLGFVLALWCWLMTLFFLGAFELRRHVRWLERHAADEAGRAGRMAELRGKLEREVEKTIRPVPRSSGEVRLDE